VYRARSAIGSGSPRLIFYTFALFIVPPLHIMRVIEHLNGHFHSENGRGYFAEFFTDAAVRCDAVILTSAALIESDFGLCPRTSTEMLAGELIRRLGYALLSEEIVDELAGARDTELRCKPQIFALGSATINDDLSNLRLILKRQCELVSGSFGPLTAGDLPLLIAISIDNGRALTGIMDELSYSRRSKIFHASRFHSVNAPRYRTETRKSGILDLITLWPFKLDG
jgi:hypothetical protein